MDFNDRSSIQESNSLNDRGSDIVASQKTRSFPKVTGGGNTSQLVIRPSMPESYLPYAEVNKADMQTSTRENVVESARKSNKSLQVLIESEKSERIEVVEEVKIETAAIPTDDF
jgi:hypothetical protein